MDLSLTIGLASFLLLLFAFFTILVTGGNEGKKEHIFLRLFLIFVFLNFLLLMGKAGLDNCHTIIANETVTGNVTTFTYAQTCFSQPTTTAVTFYKQITRLFYGFWIYILLYVTYVWLRYKGFFEKIKPTNLKKN